MRLMTGIIILLLITSITYPVEMTVSALEEASHRYKDPDLFYDLGVLYANEGKTGKAILNFKKARLLDPSDKKTFENLNALRQTIGIPPYFSESSPIEKAVLFPFNIFSLNGGLVFGLILFAVGSAGLALVLSNLMRSPFLKKIRTGSVVAMTVGLVYLAAAFIRYQFIFDDKNAVILSDCSLLERPDEQAATLNEITGGMECVVRDASDGYYRVSTLDGHEGWTVRTNVERLWEGEE